MSLYAKTRSKRVGCMTTLSIFFLLSVPLARTQIGLRLPSQKTSLTPLIHPLRTPAVSLSTPLSLMPSQYPRSAKHTITIDSTGQFVTVTHRLQSLDILIPRYLSFQDYLSGKSRIEAQNLWREYTSTHVIPRKSQIGGGRGLTLETGRIKSEAFRRVFGGETLSLNVKGNITIDGRMRNEKRSQVKTAINRGPNTSFQMKQTQRFNVEGKIGQNVSVFVDQDSERPFEFENAIKLNYSSDEDGIIQKIEAGNVALSLPSTRFVTFSARNSGLFGLKTEMKVGNLNLTAIASMEKGQKKKLSLTGGKEDQTYDIQDYEYKRSTYYFLNYDYRKQFVEKFISGVHGFDPQWYITQIELYKSDYNYENRSDVIEGWAVLDPNDPDTSESNLESYEGYFTRLDPSDYFVDRALGYIVMNMALQESEVLAVAYRDSMYHLTHGQFGEYGTLPDSAGTFKQATIPILKLIKPRNPRPSDETWYLEWKNVYSLGGRDIDREGFEVKIYYKPPSGDPQESHNIDGNPRSFLNIFGLDNVDEYGNPNPDNVIDIDPNILSLARGELIFPDLTPFNPEGDSPLPDEMRTRAIYDTTLTTYIRQQSKFYIQVKSSKRSPSYSLGMNVIEGTEEVLLNGARLQRDKDYNIDYFSGQLTILNEEATNPNANVEINYESQRLMSVDKKSLMGVRAEYNLWEEGTNKSFIGGTLLYLNQRTIDRRIRVGRDAPMRNLVWDVNTALQFQTNFITRALDALPLLNVSGPSSVSFEGEIAQVVPNPNTLNNESTGDNDGVAYLDDFEGANRKISLGVLRSGWGPSSAPIINGTKADLARRGLLFWYNPFHQVQIQEIWPDREVTTNFGGTTRIHVLTLVFTPGHTSGTTSWSGIQRALSAGYADQTDSRFLELWVQGDHGRLHIDLGYISEDVIPNQKLNTEDKRRGGFRNDLLDEGEDTGIDGILGVDPPTQFYPHEPSSVVYGTAAPYDFWDINGDSTKQNDEPWSYDDWKYATGGDYFSNDGSINGTEGNKNDGITIYPDTEDLNRNGDVDLNNDYFEFSFSLEKDHPDTIHIEGGKGNLAGWRLYRIPLAYPDNTVGNPDWSRIEFARIWIDSLDTQSLPPGQESAVISIAEINLVGNEWKLRGVAPNDTSTYDISDDSTLTIAVINTHDNPEYEAPPGVEGVIDPIQRIRSKEQALVIQLQDLDPGETALAQKQFYQAENLLNYHMLKMFVHGGGTNYPLSPEDSVEFFLQWGSDTQSKDYYEVRLPVYPGWDERNNIEVHFQDLSRLKIEMESTDSDTITETQGNGHTITIVGKPSLTNIRWLNIGVKNINKEHRGFTGQVWINELRISNVRKDKGMAMRAMANIRLSDFIAFSGDYNKKDADFHTVNERFGMGSNTEGGNINLKVELSKLIPTSWGISLPATANYAKSRSTPKFRPGSDILVNTQTAPESYLKQIRTENEKKSFNVSYSKRTKARNFWVRYLVDPFQGSFNYSQSDQSSSQMKSSTNVGYKGGLSYNLSFGDQYYWEPFEWMGKNGFLKNIAQIKFYYLPSKVSFRMDGNENTKNSETRGGVVSHVKTKNLVRNLSTSFRPFQALSFDITRSQSFDMLNSLWTDAISSMNPGEALSRTQNISTNFTPKLFSWLTQSFKYSANYRWNYNPQMKTQQMGQSANVSANFTFSGTFDTKKLVQAFSKKTSRAASRARQPVRRRRPEQKEDDPQEEKKEEKKEKKVFPLLSVFSLVGNLIQKIDPISLSITQTKSANDRGLLGTPSFAYQIGSALDPGVPYSPNATNPSTTREDNRIQIRSGFSIISQLTTKLDYSYSSSENQTTQITGNTQRSTLLWKDTDFPFPNWTLQCRGLEKLPLLSRLTKSVSLSHNFSGKKTETWNEQPDSVTQVTISRDFRPLVGLSFTFKNGLTTNIQYTTTESIQEQTKYSSGRTKRTSTNLNITAKYDLRGGLKIPFFKKRIENAINISVTFTSSLNATSQSREAKGEYVDMSRTKNWSFQPKITYTFTRTVRGGIDLELGEREDLRMGKTKITAFGINANISLSGG
jgi:cell surface protein SprA